MNIANSSTARFNNSKGNSPNSNKKNKKNNLKIDVIIDNIIKARKDNNPDFSNNKSNPRRENKRGGRFYN